jgi:hypothetical protein
MILIFDFFFAKKIKNQNHRSPKGLFLAFLERDDFLGLIFLQKNHLSRREN